MGHLPYALRATLDIKTIEIQCREPFPSTNQSLSRHLLRSTFHRLEQNIGYSRTSYSRMLIHFPSYLILLSSSHESVWFQASTVHSLTVWLKKRPYVILGCHIHETRFCRLECAARRLAMTASSSFNRSLHCGVPAIFDGTASVGWIQYYLSIDVRLVSCSIISIMTANLTRVKVKSTLSSAECYRMPAGQRQLISTSCCGLLPRSRIQSWTLKKLSMQLTKICQLINPRALVTFFKNILNLKPSNRYLAVGLTTHSIQSHTPDICIHLVIGTRFMVE